MDVEALLSVPANSAAQNLKIRMAGRAAWTGWLSNAW